MSATAKSFTLKIDTIAPTERTSQILVTEKADCPLLKNQDMWLCSNPKNMKVFISKLSELIYHEDLEKWGGCGVVAHERYERKLSH